MYRGVICIFTCLGTKTAGQVRTLRTPRSRPRPRRAASAEEEGGGEEGKGRRAAGGGRRGARSRRRCRWRPRPARDRSSSLCDNHRTQLEILFVYYRICTSRLQREFEEVQQVSQYPLKSDNLKISKSHQKSLPNSDESVGI